MTVSSLTDIVPKPVNLLTQLVCQLMHVSSVRSVVYIHSAHVILLVIADLLFGGGIDQGTYLLGGGGGGDRYW